MNNNYRNETIIYLKIIIQPSNHKQVKGNF